MRFAIGLALWTALSLGAAACGETSETAPSSSTHDTSSVRSAEPLPRDVWRGVSLAHNYQGGGARGYGSPTSAASLAELRALGATWVSLTPFGFADGLDASDVHGAHESPPQMPAGGETDARLRAEIRAARGLGLRVLLKPHVWIRGGAFRGDLRPRGGVDAFLASHERFVLHYATLAEETGVDALVIGVELDSTVVAGETAWRQTIGLVRQRFSGDLIYAANWDAVERVPFWDALDRIGVQFYPPLGEPTDDAGALHAGALARLDAFANLSRRTGRPVVLTEVGYRATPNAHVVPHAWPERDRRAPRVDVEAQAHAYVALLAGVRRRPFVKGLFVWKWFSDPASTEEGPAGFSPRGRPAAEILSQAFRPPSQ